MVDLLGIFSVRQCRLRGLENLIAPNFLPEYSLPSFSLFFQRHTLNMESGTKLAHYEISTLLGKGGMGEVWRARDTKLGRKVAIKTLPAEFS